MTYPQKITFGELCESGVRDVLIRDHRYSHSTEISADRWPDHVRLSDIEPNFTCTHCSKKGAEVRPKFSPARMGTGRCPGWRGSSISRAPANSYLLRAYGQDARTPLRLI
jgi:hypothetical protein